MMMPRLHFLLLVLVLAATACGADAPTTKPAAAAAWAFHGGGAMLGRAPALPVPPMNLRWTYRCDEEGDAGVSGAAVIDGTTAYVADGKGLLHAIELATGKRRWTYEAAEDGFAAGPLLCGDRIVIGDLGGVVHAVSIAKGEKLWTRETGAS